MTSASELFSNWRSRAGRAAGPDSDRDPDPYLWRPFVSDRDLLPVRRRRSGRGGSRRRHEAAVGNRFLLDHVSGSDLDRNNLGDTYGSNRHDSMSFVRNERLPNTVLQARQRVSERLRGASPVGNRHRVSIAWDESEDEVIRIIDFGDRRSPTDQHVPTSNYMDTNVELYEPFYFPDIIFANKRPPGLTTEEFDHLELDVYKSEGDQDDISAPSDCSICLEQLCDGNQVVVLHCGHQFHPNCLKPWAIKCGDCPYCRTTILS